MAETEQSRDKTEYLELIKPKKTEYFNVDDQNTNSDILDAKLKEHKERMDSQSERIQEIETGVRSATKTTRKMVTSYPENTMSGGSVDIKGLKGLSFRQLNRNGNGNLGVDEAAGFTYSRGDGALSDGNLLVTCYEDSPTGIIDKNTFIPAPSTETYFVHVRVKPLSEEMSAIHCQLGGTTGGTNYSASTFSNTEPVVGTWHDHYVKAQFPSDATGNLKVRIYATLLDDTSAGTQYEIDMKTGIRVIPLPDELMDVSAEELLCLSKNMSYWEGIRSVENVKLVSRGKNLADICEFNFNGYRIGEDDGKLFHEGSDWGYSNFIPVKPNTKYIWSHGTRLAFYSDANTSAFLEGTAQVGGISRTSPVSANYIRISVRETYKSEFMLVEGDTLPSEYVAYDFTESDIIGSFRSLPNGITDGIETAIVDGVKKIRKVEYVGRHIITADDMTDTLSVSENFAYKVIYLPTNKTQVGYENAELGNDLIVGMKFEREYADSEELIGQYYTSVYNDQDVIKICLDKDAKDSAFAEDIIGTEVLYELAEPKYGEWQDCIPSSFENGDIVLTSDSGLLPELQFRTPVNQGAVLTDIAEKVTAHQAFIEDLAGVDSPEIALTSESPVASFEVKNSGVEPVIKGFGQMLTNLAPVQNGDCRRGWNTNHNITNGYFTESDNSVYTPYFDIPCEPGKTYTVFAKGYISEGTAYAFVQCRFLDINDEKLETYNINFDKTTAESKMVLLSNAPDNTAKLRVYGIVSSGTIFYKDLMVLAGDYTNRKLNYVAGRQNLSDIAFEIRSNMIYEPDFNDSTRVGRITATFENGVIRLDNSENIKTRAEFRATVYLEHGQKYTYNEFNKNQISGEGLLKLVNPIDSTLSLKVVENGIPFMWTLPSGWYDFVVVTASGTKEIIELNIVLIKGEQTIKQYIPPYKSTAYLKGNEHFTENDTFKIENGKVVVHREVSNPVELNGDQNWSIRENDPTQTFKVVQSTNSDGVKNTEVVTKYNGKILDAGNYGVQASVADQSFYSGSQNIISISNNDSGWDKDFSPSIEEVKAYFNGWVMCGPSLSIHSDGDDKYWYKRYQGIGTSSETAFGILVENDTTQTVCPREKAYGEITECYTLQYELAQPESYEVDLWGVPTLPEGQCHVALKSGIRIEKAKVLKASDNMYKVNYIGSDTLAWTPLKKKVKRIIDWIIDDGNEHYKKEFIISDSEDASYGGIQHAYISGDDFTEHEADHSYIVYETLSEENNSGIFQAELEYNDDAQSAIKTLRKTLEHTEEMLEVANSKIAELTQIKVTQPELLNNWVNYGDGLPPARVIETAHCIEFSGMIKSGALETAMFKIPPVLSQEISFPVYTSSGLGRIIIYPAGDVYFKDGGTGFVSLDGVRIRKGIE